MSRPPIGPRIDFAIPPELLAAVEAIARNSGVSRGAVLREAVEMYVRRRKARKEKA